MFSNILWKAELCQHYNHFQRQRLYYSVSQKLPYLSTLSLYISLSLSLSVFFSFLIWVKYSLLSINFNQPKYTVNCVFLFLFLLIIGHCRHCCNNFSWFSLLCIKKKKRKENRALNGTKLIEILFLSHKCFRSKIITDHKYKQS